MWRRRRRRGRAGVSRPPRYAAGMVRPARPGHAGAAAAPKPRLVAGRQGGAALEAAAWGRRRLGGGLASGPAAGEIAYNERYTPVWAACPAAQNAYNAGTLYAGRRPRWRPSNRGGSRAAAVAGLSSRPFPAPSAGPGMLDNDTQRVVPGVGMPPAPRPGRLPVRSGHRAGGGNMLRMEEGR